MNRTQLIASLWHGIDPLSNTPTNLYQEDLQGWRSDHEYLLSSIESLRPQLICEIGVWKGASVISMASKLKQASIASTIVAVDTWLGSVEHWRSKELFDNLSLNNGYPSIFQKFRNNIVRSGLQEYVVPLPLDSLNAAAVLQSAGVVFDMIHLDAGHDYRSVLADLRAWWPRLRNGGVLIGDDYEPGGEMFPGVAQAFDEFFGDLDLAPFPHLAGKCMVLKPA